jgi:2-polyprenyl-3-methyl-5-hydroxy-6-metoxy-1,4-benzoquinol methylase
MGGRVHLHDASIYELLPPPRGLTLDVGCGEGRLTRELSARGYEVVGVDASTALVEEARSATRCAGGRRTPRS